MFKKGGHVRFTFIRMYSVAEMAQQVPRIFTYPLIEPLTYFELCRELSDHDSTIRSRTGTEKKVLHLAHVMYDYGNLFRNY